MGQSLWPTKPAGSVYQRLFSDLLCAVSQIWGNTFRINRALFPDFQLDPYTQNSVFFSIINVSICTLRNITKHSGSETGLLSHAV